MCRYVTLVRATIQQDATLRRTFRFQVQPNVMSPICMFTTILQPSVWHYGRCHLGFLEPEA